MMFRGFPRELVPFSGISLADSSDLPRPGGTFFLTGQDGSDLVTTS